MSTLVLTAKTVQCDSVTPDEKKAIIAAAKNGGPEFCVCCWKTLPYPAMSTHIYDPKRWADGAHYTEGAGQTCAECAD